MGNCSDEHDLQDMTHCCDLMAEYLTITEFPLVYIPKYREYGIRVLDGGSSYITIGFCPWCGSRLPNSKRDEWFNAIEKMGLEPGTSDIPPKYTTDMWWKTEESGQNVSPIAQEPRTRPHGSPTGRNRSNEYLILSVPMASDSSKYRGTDRDEPSPIGIGYKDEKERAVFEWYFNERDAIGSLKNLQRARALVDFCGCEGRCFEIVRVLRGNDVCSKDELMLGFDICESLHDSLLVRLGKVTGPEGVHSLLKLLGANFMPRLNSNGLFNTREDAEFCLTCMMELQGLYPGIWEAGIGKFEVVGLCLVYRPSLP